MSNPNESKQENILYSDTFNEQNELNDIQNFEIMVLEKIQKYFSTNDYFTQETLPNFLNFVGLGEWKSEDELNCLWNTFSKYSRNGKVDLDGCKTGLFDFIFNQDEEVVRTSCVGRLSMNAIKRFSNVNYDKNINHNEKNNNENKNNENINENNINENHYIEKNNIDNSNINKENKEDFKMNNDFKEIKYEKNLDILIEKNESEIIRKILCLFNIMQLGIRDEISSMEIENTIQKNYHLQIEYNLFINFFMHFSEITNYENGIYTFKIDEEKYNQINNKLKNIVDEYKKTYILNKTNIYGESKESFIYCLEDIIQCEKESEIYPNIIINGNNICNKSLSNEIVFLSEKRQINLENLRVYYAKLLEKIDNYIEEINNLNNKISDINDNKDKKDFEIEKIKRECNKYQEEIQIKNNLLNNMKKEISEKENEKDELTRNLNDEIIKNKTFNQKIIELNFQIEQEKKNYDNLLNNVVGKIEKENEKNRIKEEEKEKRIIEKEIKQNRNNTNSNFFIDSLNSQNNSNENINEINKNKKIFAPGKVEEMSKEELKEYSIKLDKDNNDLYNQINELKKKIIELEKRNKTIEKSNEQYKNENIVLISENEKLNNEKKDLKDELDNYKKDNNNTINYLLDLNNDNNNDNKDILNSNSNEIINNNNQIMKKNMSMKGDSIINYINTNQNIQSNQTQNNIQTIKNNANVYETLENKKIFNENIIKPIMNEEILKHNLMSNSNINIKNIAMYSNNLISNIVKSCIIKGNDGSLYTLLTMKDNTTELLTMDEFNETYLNTSSNVGNENNNEMMFNNQQNYNNNCPFDKTNSNILIENNQKKTNFSITNNQDKNNSIANANFSFENNNENLKGNSNFSIQDNNNNMKGNSNFTIQNNNIINNSNNSMTNQNENDIISSSKTSFQNPINIKTSNTNITNYNFIGTNNIKKSNISKKNLKKIEKISPFNFALNVTGEMMDGKSTNELDYLDDVNLIEGKKYKKTKVILNISNNMFWIQKSQNGIFDLRYPLNDINKIHIAETNENILAIEFSKNNQETFIIETFRRMTLLNYLKMKLFQINNNKNYFVSGDTFNLKKNNESSLILINNVLKFSPNFEGAEKFGYLYRLHSSLKVKKFVLRLVILTNIGILIFDDPLNKPEKFIPLINIQITDKIGLEKPSSFELISSNKESNIFGADNEDYINGWKKAIMGIHNKYAKGVREILKKANFDSKNSNNDNKKSKILMFGN